MARQYFRRGNRLYRLPQSHIVADQRPANPDREQRALGLIRIERNLQKGLQLAIDSTLWEQLLKLRGASDRVLPSRNEIERIVICAQLVTALRHFGNTLTNLAKAVVRQHLILFGG